MRPHLRVRQPATAVGQPVGRIHIPVGDHPQAGPKVHAVVVCPVDKHRQRVEPALDQTLHVVPRAPIGGQIKGLNIRSEHHSHSRWIEKPVAALDPVGKSIHPRTCNLVYWHPSVFERHRRLKGEQVVMPSIVKVDSALLPHGVSSLF